MQYRKCEKCEFFTHFDYGRVTGTCRRYPPAPQIGLDLKDLVRDKVGTVVVVTSDFWCGEFKKREIQSGKKD